MSLPLVNILAAFGAAILNSFWQVGLLWLATLVYARGNRPFAHVNNMAFGALVLGFLAFWGTLIRYLILPKNLWAFWQMEGNFMQHLLPLAGALYLLMLFLPISRLFRKYKYVTDLRNTGLTRLPGTLRLFTLDAAAHLGIRKKVAIWASSLVNVPMTIGFLKPVILLPVAILNQLSTTQVEAVIMHELAHIRSKDYLINFLSRIMQAVLYFNPFATALVNIQDSEREKAADKWVLQFEYDRTLYASALLALAVNKTQPQYLTIKATGDKQQLLERVKYILGENKRYSHTPKQIWEAVFTTITLFVLCAVKLNTPSPYQTSQDIAFENPVKQTTALEDFFIPAKNTSDSVYRIRPIPVMETPENEKWVYLKLEHTATPAKKTKTANIEEQTVEESPAILYVSNEQTDVAKLSPEKEKNIESAVAATKRIMADQSWQAIEMGIAETMSERDKQLLKHIYIKLYEQANLPLLKNQLRANYNQINWDSAAAKLQATTNALKADSLYNTYNLALQEMQALQKTLGKDSAQQAASNVLNKEIRKLTILLHRVDSLRSRKIVEL
ncbi:MAG: M56 family metallopeptidase [Niabella sp.]